MRHWARPLVLPALLPGRQLLTPKMSLPLLARVASWLGLPGVQAAEHEMLKIGNKMRFILAVVAGELRISNRRKADVVADLERGGFDRLPPARKACCHVLYLGSLSCQCTYVL